MSKVGGSYDDAFFNKLQFIPVSPWSLEVECLDVLTVDKADEGFLTKVFGSRHSERIREENMFRHGSMLDPKLVRDISAWDKDPGALRKGLDQLKDPKFSVQPGVPGFKKEQLPDALLTFKHSGKLSATLTAAFSCTSAISADESLTLTVGGLTAASVPYERIIDWTEPGKGAWVPNLERRGLNWSTKPGSVNSIWVVTSVLYATELTVGGRDGVFAGVKVEAPMAVAVPGLPGTVGAGLNVQKLRDNQLVVKAVRRKNFRVGYRAIRLDYNPDGTPRKTVGKEYIGFRGGDDDLAQQHLKCMKEELFVVGEDGLVETIPLLTPSEAELDEIEATELQHA